MVEKIITSESVTEGHPDKVCDQISDAILDAHLCKDSLARVAVETLATKNLIVLAGEVTSTASVDYEVIVRHVLREIGYTSNDYGMDAESVEILVKIQKQSPDIAQGVNENEGDDQEQGAGDQGIMFGYASDETPELMPLPILLAHRLTAKLAEVRHSKEILHLGPDGKAQVSVKYVDEVPIQITAIVIAQQHTKDISEEELREQLFSKVVTPICKEYVMENTTVLINGTGSFILGGPAVDTGLTGRKIIVDTYGGVGRHGGGAFSGKDPSKVDRSAAYMARYIAKSILAKGLAKRCEIQISYCIGQSKPLSVYVNSFGTGSDSQILSFINLNFDLRPRSIIMHLNLLNPIYKKTAKNGHFGHKEFSWEDVA